MTSLAIFVLDVEKNANNSEAGWATNPSTQNDTGVEPRSPRARSRLERAYYWKLENGRINVTIETLIKISDALGVDIAELFERANKR